jgi:hypothetical protein
MGLLGLGVFAGATVSSVSPAQEKGPPGQKWQYKVVDARPVENDMNQLGAEGWDLVGYTVDAGRHHQIYKRLAR